MSLGRRSTPRRKKHPIQPPHLVEVEVEGVLDGFPEHVRSEVEFRSRGECEARLPGCARRASQHHHRQRRTLGDHSAANDLHVCTECHTRLHSMGEEAYRLGLLVRRWEAPEAVEVFPGGRLP